MPRVVVEPDRPGPPGPPGFGAYHDDFIANAGQTVFSLSRAATAPSLVLVIVNHEGFYPPDVIVSNTTFTWDPTNTFPLQAGMTIRVYYE